MQAVFPTQGIEVDDRSDITVITENNQLHEPAFIQLPVKHAQSYLLHTGTQVLFSPKPNALRDTEVPRSWRGRCSGVEVSQWYGSGPASLTAG